MRGPVGFAGFASGSSAVDRHLAQRGIFHQQAPPRGAPSVRITIRDVGGLDCDGALWLFAAWRDLEASVWVTLGDTGTIHLVDRTKPRAGRITRAAETVSVRSRRGKEITITAAGPDASEALEVCREMLGAHPSERKEMYRRRRNRGEGVR